MSQTIGQSCRYHCRYAIRTIPSRNAQWLLCTSIPLARDDTEQRKTASLEQTQKEPAIVINQANPAKEGKDGTLWPSTPQSYDIPPWQPAQPPTRNKARA